MKEQPLMGLEGILPVIPTPFRDGRFDEPSFAAMIERSAGSVDGYTVLGSTGEAPSMSTVERREVAERMVSVIPDGLTVVIGVTHTAVADGVELARHAGGLGAAGVLCASPFYFGTSPDGVLAYLERIDEALETELVFYDNPAATKMQLRAEDVAGWAAQLEHLNTVKLTDHDLSKVGAWQEAGLTVLAGDDPIVLRFLEAGVDGAMVIAPVVFPEAFREVWDRMRAGDVAGATERFGEDIAAFLHVFGIGDEIATTKALFASIGVFASAEVRTPLVGVDARRSDLLRAAYGLARSTRAGGS
jgi:4-hydroxy-tetrahydrodipicolinate synthase